MFFRSERKACLLIVIGCGSDCGIGPQLLGGSDLDRL